MSKESLEVKLKELEKRLSDLKARWPRHSVPASMAMEFEELEEEIERIRKELSSSREREHGG